MNFFRNIKNSVYNPLFYRNLADKPRSFSIKYFILLALSISLIFSTVVTWRYIPLVKNLTSEETINSILKFYPPNLEIQIKNGAAVSNANEPYFIQMPKNISSNLKNLAVINTKENFDSGEFQNFSAAILISKDAFVYKENGNKIIVQNYGNLNTVINMAQIEQWINKIKPFASATIPLAFIGIFIFKTVTSMFTLIYLLAMSLIIMLVAKLKKIPRSYGNSYKIGLHAVTLGFIFDVIFLLIGISTPAFFFTGIFLIAVILNLQQERSIATTPVNPPHIQF